MSKGSSYRYLGRTQNELTEFVRENSRKLGLYDRSASTGRVSTNRSPSLSATDLRQNALSSTAVNSIDPSQSIGSGSISCDVDDSTNQVFSDTYTRSLASLQGGLGTSSDGLKAQPVAYVQLPQRSANNQYSQPVMLVMRPGATGGLNMVPIGAVSSSSAYVLSPTTTTTTATTGPTISSTTVKNVPHNLTRVDASGQFISTVDRNTQRTPGFLVMLPQPSTDQSNSTSVFRGQQQQFAWISAVHDQNGRALSSANGRPVQRTVTPVPLSEAYAVMQNSMLIGPSSNCLSSLGAKNQQLSHTLDRHSAGFNHVPHDGSNRASAVLPACPLLPTQRSTGRVVYVDSATGRIIQNGQVLALPRTAFGNSLLTPTRFAVSPPPLVISPPLSSGVAGSTLAPTGDDAVVSVLLDDPVQATTCLNQKYQPSISSSTSVFQHDFGKPGVVLRSRPSGPPPPAPERRDSVHPRDRQNSSEQNTAAVTIPMGITLDCQIPSTNDLPALPTIMSEPDPAHPFPFNVIPVGVEYTTTRPSMAFSCLSLAARSARSSCQSLADEDEEETGSMQRSCISSSRDSYPVSRCASLHRSLSSSASRSLRQSQEHLAATLGDLTLLEAAVRQQRCHSAVDSVLSTESNKLADRSSKLSYSSQRNDGTVGVRRSSSSARHAHRAPTSVAYHLLRELTMTERNYKRDLDVVCEHFRNFASTEISLLKDNDDSVFPKLFNLADPLRVQSADLLRDFESRLSSWSGKLDFGVSDSICRTSSSGTSFSLLRVGDLFVNNLGMLQLYRDYMTEVETLILGVERIVRSQPVFERKIQEFESQKFCYLPFYSFLLKPMHRLLQYRAILERLMRHYSESHVDMQDCRVSHARLLDTIQSQWDYYKRSENLHKCIEIERDLIGLQKVSSVGPSDTSETPGPPESSQLAHPSGQFIREGLLQKLSKKGHQQRMFFLFSDQLIYASRTNAPFLQFKVHGQLPLRDLMVEEVETQLSFTIVSGSRSFLVSSISEWQRDRWLMDISRAILAAKTTRLSPSFASTSSVTISSGEKNLTSGEKVTDRNQSPENGSSSDVDRVLHRATTSVHVCWHRSFTFSMADILRANEYQTSGYLLRKFKNSNGWQKLWVVFTQLCMFFHKSYQDTFPLASLPLLGYTITVPAPEDQIRKDYVFKLQFKSHVYFFRDDSQSSFERWMDCLSSAVGTSVKQRIVNSRS